MGNRMMPTFGIFILTTLLVFTEAGPVNKLRALETCAVQCSGNHKFDYQPGTIYEFSYDAKTTTKMNGASEDSAMIDMTTTVEIEPITKCDLVMRIKDASLRDSEDDQNSQAFKEAMMKQPLKFSFQDGRIDHICEMAGESTWTLNIKRGILSAFQNSMDSFDRNQNLTETDVVGSCDAEYKILSEGRTKTIVKKTKNLLGCSDREGYRLAVQSIGYNVPSFVKSLPLMKSEHKCTQTLDLKSNILQSSTCLEEHVFRPFSYGKNGAMTTSEQTLTFTNKRKAAPSSNENFSQRSTLLFQHQHDTSSKQESEEKIEAKLHELCREDIRPEVPEMVNQLIEHMRQVDRDVLSKVYKKINQKKICATNADRIKQYFHDAIPMVGTAGSVGMIQDLISKKHVTGSEAEMWLLSLSFVHHPTKEMVAAATPLLGEPDVSGNTLLAISSLASSYCNARPDCGSNSEITVLISKLIDLTNDCNAQNGDARRIVFALRALGNIGHSHVAVSHLTRCSTRRDVPEEIRIAAMDAFRRVPCDAMRSDLMGVFRDESEDSELRLNAYIALMKCPSKNVLSEVREVLEKEKSNQVGSFVWTHLTNLMETSDPHMQDIRNIVQDEELKKEFNLDQRKFSRNYEGSFFLDSINTGAKVDSNVIFSEKSFIPRSANLNLTIDLFGHAINFLEFGGRVQGMERILENFFGPTGVTEPKMNTQIPTNFDKTMDTFRASAFMRVFGNELRYWDDKSLNELQSSLRKLMNMQAISFSKTMQLIDSRMIIPTCVGLPLNLTMSATGSISLDAKASFQRSEVNVNFQPSASVQVKGEMSVDAHVSRAGLKMVTVAHTSSGAMLNIRNNKFDLQIPKKKMEIFNLKTDFYIVHRNTEKKQKMIVDNVQKHEICTGDLMKQVTGLTFCQNIKFPNASNQNEAPFFPFTGPVVYDLYMMNEDAPNGYQIEGFTKQSPYSFYVDTPDSKVSRRIAFDTAMKNKNEAHITIKAPWKNIKIEGTAINMGEIKKLTGKLSLNEKTGYNFNAELGMKNTKGLLSFTPKFELAIPKNKMSYEGKIEMRPMKSLMIDMSAKGFTASDVSLKVSGEIVPKEIGFTTQLRVGKKEYYIATRMGKLVSKSGFKYSPSLKITIPGKDLVEFNSEIAYESNKKMSFDFKLNKVLSKTVAMNAIVLLNAGKAETKHILRVIFKSPRGTFRINGDMDKQKTGITSRIIGSYNFGAKFSDHLTLSSKIRNLSVKSMRYMGNIALTSKKQQSLNFNLKGQFAKAANHMETKFDLQYGNPKIKTNNLKFSCVLNRALKPISHTYDYTITIQHPGQKFDYKMEMHHLQSAAWPFKKFENTMIVHSASEIFLKTSLSYMNGKEKGSPCYKTEASISYPGKDAKISGKVIQSGANGFANYLDVQLQNENIVSIYSSYNKTRAGVYSMETIVSLAGKKEIKFNGMVHATTGAYKSKLSMEADAGLISNERINYMAKSSIQYKLKATQVSTDASFEMMWAEDKKMSGSFNLKYTQGVLLNSRLVLLTPYGGLKNFDSKIKWGWGENKFTALVTSSLNNKINIKQDFTYTYPDFQVAYTSHVDFLGKTSDVVIVLGLEDSSFNCTMKIMKDKEIIGDISAGYTGHKAKIDNEIQLRFTMMASSGKININSKFDPKQQMLELNGLAKLNLPLQQLDASYGLKHNKYVSSLDMIYSSSSGNGKMTIRMKRNFPKMLKANMDLTLNDTSVFNMNANYGRQRDNIDMKIDITEPNGQKITVSGNVNLSGSRKTGTVELKSNYINLSADGAFEYQGTRSASGELKMTAEGKSVMIKADYKKEGSIYKVTGTFGLPDRRSLSMEGSLDSQNNAVTLKTMNPDFPELTEIDTAFSFKKQMSSRRVSLKMMPYFDTTQTEIKFTKKQFSIEMKTQFESMKQVKVAVTFDGDWIRSQKVEAVFQLNNEKMVDLDMNYNFSSITDFAVSMTALTSHRRYKEFQFDLMNKGPQSSLKVKFANVLMLDAMFQNSRKVSKVSIDAQLLDFDELKSTFVLKGNLDDMTAKIITNIAKKEVNRIDVSLKENGRLVNLKVKGPEAVNFDFNMNVDTEAITFNMASTFTLNGREKYEMSASYEHLSKLQIKTSIPSYEDELLITFSGNLKDFNAQTKFGHNNQMYELMLSNKDYYRQVKGHLNTPYFQDTLSFKFGGEFSEMNIFAQVMHNKDTFELTFSNKGYYRQLKGVLNTPYFQDTATFKFDGELREMNILAQVMHNKDKFELTFSNKGYYRQLKGVLNTPYFQDTATFKFDGELREMNILAQVMHNKDKFELTFSNKGYYRQLKGVLNTPYFQDTASSRIGGELSEMNVFAQVMHNDEKFELTFSNKGYYKKIDAKLTTPYFQPTLKFSLVGIPEKFNVALKIQFDKQMYEMKASNEGYFRQMNLMLDTPLLTCNSQFEGDSENAKGTFFVTFGKTKYDVTFTHTGSLKDMQTTLLYKLNGKEQCKSNLLIKGHGATITAMMKVPGTLDFEFESEWDMRSISFNLRSDLELQKVEIYKIVATYEHMTKLQVNTSVLSYKGEVMMTLDKNENANLKLKLAHALTLNVMFQNSRKVTKVSVDSQLLDYDECKSTFVLKGNLDDMTAKLVTSIAKKEVNRIDVSLKGYGRSINVKVNGPKVANFDFNMNIDTEAITFNMASTFTLNGREKYEMSASYEHLSKFQIKTSIPSYEDELLITFSGNLTAFKAQTKFSHNNQMYELTFSNKDYYRQLKGILNTPYFQDTVTFKFDGEVREMNILAQVMHNEEKFELTFSNKGYYKKIDSKLETPYSQSTFKSALTGNLNRFNFELNAQFNNQMYEMKASNEDYYRIINFLVDTPFLKCNCRFAGDLDNAKGSLMISYGTTTYEVSLTHSGSLDDMQTTVFSKLNGREQFQSKLQIKGYGATIITKVTIPETLNFEFDSEWDTENVSFNLRSSLELLQEEIYKIAATYEHLAKLYIKTSVLSYNDELTMTLNGDKKMFNALAKFTHNESKYELIISNQGYYRKVDAQLITPFFTDMASFIFNGDEETFTAQAKFMHNNKQCELTVSNRNHYHQMAITLSTPFSSDKLDIDTEGNLSSFDSLITFSHNKVDYKLQLSNKGYYRKINAKLTTPSFRTGLLFKLKGNLQTFNSMAEFIFNEEKFTLALSNKDYYKQMSVKLITPLSNNSVLFSLDGTLNSFNAKVKYMNFKDVYELVVYNSGYYREIEAKLSTPYFRDMLSISMDGKLSDFTVRAKVMHNHENYQMTVSNARYYRNLSVELITPFYEGSVDFSLKGNLQSFNIVTKVMHNKDTFQLAVSNVNYYRQMKAELTTPFYEGSVEFSLNGNLNSFNSKLKYTHFKNLYQVVISNSGYYRNINVDLTAPGFHRSISFNIRGFPENFDITAEIKENQDHYTLAVMKEKSTFKLNANATGHSMEEAIDFNLNGNLKSFNIFTKVLHENETFQMTVSTGNYYRQIKTELATPFYKGSLEFSLKGNLKSFNMVTKVMHNNEKFQLTASTDNYYRQIEANLATPFYKGSVEFSLKGSLHSFNMITKAMHNNEMFQLTVSTDNYYRQMKGELTTPNFKGSVDFSLKGNLHSFNMVTKVMHNKEKFQLTVSNVNYYRQIKTDLTTPFYKGSVEFSLKGNLQAFNMITKVMHNDEQYQLTVSTDNYYRQIEANLTTPFYKGSVEFSLKGNLKSFNMITKVRHNNEKFQLTVSTDNYYRQIKSDLATPFYKGSIEFSLKGNLQSFNMITMAMHNNEKFQLTVSTDNYYRQLEANLATPFYKGSVEFSLKGNLQAFNMITKAMHNNEKLQLSLSTDNYYRQMKTELDTPFYKGSVEFSLKGNLQSFNIVTKAVNNKDTFQLSVSTVNYYRQIKGEFTAPNFKGSVDFSLKGNLQSFNMVTKVMHNKEKSQLTISTGNYYRQINGQLETPCYKGSLEFSLKGNLQSFNMVSKVMHNIEAFQLTVSNSNYYRQMKAELTTPYFKDSAEFSLNGTLRKFNTQLTLKHNNIVYEMSASNREFYRQMNFQLNSPFLNCGFQYSLEMTKTSFILTIEEDKYELNASSKKSFQFNDISLSTPEHKLKISSKVYHKKKSTSAVVNVQLDGLVFALTGIYKDATPKHIFNANFKSPYFNAVLQSSSLDKSRKTPANQKPSIQNYIYGALTKNSYNDLDFNLKKSGMKMKFSFKGNLQKCKVVSSLKKAADMYEVNFSNQKYFESINMEVSTPQTGSIGFKFNFQNNANRFDLNSMFSYGNDKYELNVANKIQSHQLVVKFAGPQMNVNGHLNGDIKSFSFNVNADFNKQKYEVMASAKNDFREMSGKLITPQFGEQSLTVKINGQMKDFNGFIEVKNNKDIYRSELSLNNQEIVLSLPKWLKKLQVKLNGNWRNSEFTVQLMNYNDEKFEITAINKNFQQMKVHLAIPRLEDIDVSIEMSGNLRKGETTMKMSYGENVFGTKVGISFDGRQANFEIEPHYMILGRSGKAKLQMDLMFEAQSYKYEFEAEVEGTQVKSMASVKISPDISVFMTVSLPTFDASEMKLRIVSSGFQKIDMMLNLKSPWTGMAKIFYDHNVQMGKSFSTKGYIEQDGSRLAGYSLDTDFPNDYSFDFMCDYGKNKIETKGYLKFQGVKRVATVSINTPFRVFKEFFASAQIKSMRDGQIKAELDVKIPNQQYSLNFDLGNGNLNALLNLNKDTKYQFQTTYMNTDVSRSINVKMALPQRTVSLDSTLKNAQDSMVMTGDLTWDEAKDQKVGFKLMVQKGEQKEAKLQIITPRRTVEIFGRVGVNGNQYSTVGHIMMDENNQAQKVDISANMILGDRADIDLTVKFPNQKKGMNLKTSINLPKGDLIFSSTSEFSMDQDPKKSFKMSTKLMSETKGKRRMYTLQMDAKHPESGFDTEMVGRVSSTPDKYNADVEIGYLTLKGKQQKFAIRGEMRRFNREVNLKLEAPSKTIELDGSLTAGNRYVMSVLKKETGKENMEAVFKFNPKAQRINLIFNYDEENPDNVYRIDAEIMESKTFLKAYRAGKQGHSNKDLAIYAELKPRVLKSGIKWNINLLQEFNNFGYQKLSMYGQELKSFGDSLSQALNDEVSMKFSLAKQSFSEDMTPIIDYFTTEYRSLSVDLARAMRFMNQMFQRDSLYMKSAIEAINKVWGEMWLNYNKYLIELKQEMEVFNRDMNKKMDEAKTQFDFYFDQYSMQLKTKTDEVFDYYQEQYEMLYERAMDMEAEIMSFVKKYPEMIEDVIDWMRQNPYGEKVIVSLTEMYEAFNEKTVQVKGHVDTLTSSIYSAHATLNSHIVSARRNPIVDAIVEAVNKVYQQAVWSYNYWDIKDNVFGLRNTLYKFGAKKIKEIKNIITDIGMNTLVFDPKRGEIIVEIRFGAAKFFYNHFMSGVEDIERAVMKIRNLMPTFNLNVWDIYYMMKPSTDPEDYIPLFKAEATLFAGQHITTFDGRHLNYKGRCNYLLTRDFVDGNFTVVANFNDAPGAKTLQSLSVTTAHSEQLEIFPNNKVVFNKRVAKLPLELTDATVTLQDNVIVVESKRGYKVMCDHNLQLYTVQISGWYFNKVAGIFGNYNNEPKDDMLMSNNKYTNDLEQFVQSWSASKQCKSHRNVAPSHMVTENKECAYFFLQTDSPFRYCFRQVNPDQFYKTCAIQLSSSKATSIDLCNVTSFYQKKCEKKGVYLSTPIMCPKRM